MANTIRIPVPAFAHHPTSPELTVPPVLASFESADRAKEVAKATRKGEALAHPASIADPTAVGMVSGMAAGAGMGAVAGPPGAAVGAIIGGAIGAAAGAMWSENEEADRAKDEQLDKDIGVIDGEIGEPSLKHPPATRGLYSAAAMGVGGATGEDTESTADGPMPSAEGRPS